MRVVVDLLFSFNVFVWRESLWWKYLNEMKFITIYTIKRLLFEITIAIVNWKVRKSRLEVLFHFPDIFVVFDSNVWFFLKKKIFRLAYYSSIHFVWRAKCASANQSHPGHMVRFIGSGAGGTHQETTRTTLNRVRGEFARDRRVRISSD